MNDDMRIPRRPRESDPAVMLSIVIVIGYTIMIAALTHWLDRIL